MWIGREESGGSIVDGVTHDVTAVGWLWRILTELGASWCVDVPQWDLIVFRPRCGASWLHFQSLLHDRCYTFMQRCGRLLCCLHFWSFLHDRYTFVQRRGGLLYLQGYLCKCV